LAVWNDTCKHFRASYTTTLMRTEDPKKVICQGSRHAPASPQAFTQKAKSRPPASSPRSNQIPAHRPILSDTPDVAVDLTYIVRLSAAVSSRDPLSSARYWLRHLSRDFASCSPPALFGFMYQGVPSLLLGRAGQRYIVLVYSGDCPASSASASGFLPARIAVLIGSVDLAPTP
jgi:hypothetical protein